MILKKIIKIASHTNNYGLINSCTHKASVKNKKCGDKISVELTVNKNKIKKMRYESVSCVYCEASASLLSRNIDIFSIKKFKEETLLLNDLIKGDKKLLPSKYKGFKELISYSNFNRIECIMLPYVALIKALKFKI